VRQTSSFPDLSNCTPQFRALSILFRLVAAALLFVCVLHMQAQTGGSLTGVEHRGGA
jgi:hypothetical protein